MKIEYRPAYPKRILERRNPNSIIRYGRFASPYIGCEYGCVYCNGCIVCEPSKDFQRLVQIKLNAPTLLRKELKTQSKKSLCLWGYQPVEKEYGLMKKILEVVHHRNFSVHIITRSEMVEKDADMINRISEKSKSSVSIILNTLDHDISKIFEPYAPSPKKRLLTLEKMAKKGILVGLIIMPVVPYITDSKEHLEEIMKKAKELGAVYAVHVPLILEDNCRANVIEKIKKHFPKEMIKYRKLYEFGAMPDINYINNLKKRTRMLQARYLIEDEVPGHDYSRMVKQVKLEGF